jgi:hypothetical protein
VTLRESRAAAAERDAEERKHDHANDWNALRHRHRCLAGPFAGERRVPIGPGAIGPYAVGYMSLLLLDPSRDQQSSYRGRPIYVSLFYRPIGRRSSRQAPRHSTLSTQLLATGRCRDQVTGSATGSIAHTKACPVAGDKPFSVVMYSPGWTNPYFSGLFASTRLASHGFVVAMLTHYAYGVIRGPRSTSPNRPRTSRSRSLRYSR